MRILLDKLNIDLIFKTIPIIISFISLIISILVACSNRKTLQVEINKNLEIVRGGEIFMLDDDEIPESYGNGLLTTIEVVNPSPKDIAFFDLRAFYPETNLNVHLLTKRTIFDKFRDKPCWRAIESQNGEVNLMELIIPETNYGIFKANSFTRFHIVVFPNTDTKKLNLSFKVAIKARIKDKFAVTGRKKFKFYGVSYDINSWHELGSESQ